MLYTLVYTDYKPSNPLLMIYYTSTHKHLNMSVYILKLETKKYTQQKK